MPQLPAITLLSLLHFAGALLWCGLVLLSTAGYGAALLRLARLPRPGLTLSATAGFGVVLALGGVLNLAHRITVPALLSTVAAGLVAGLLAIFWRRPGTTVIHPRPARGTLTLPGKLLLATFALVFVLRLGASVHTPYYQPSDDYNFYLAAPVKMLETHIFGPDPFSERRVMSSVGGNHFLEVLVLAELPLEDLQMADRALGLMLSALLAFALAREFRLPPNDSAAWALFVLATPQLQFNLTFVILPAALFFGMVYVAVAELGFPAALGFPAELGHTAHLSHRPWLRGILLGLLAGAVTSLKSTYIVPSITFLLCFAVLVLWRSAGRTATAKLLLAAAMAAAAVLLPWSIVNHTAAGTWFYPTLGLGFHYTRWGGFAPPGNHSATVLLFKVLPFSLPPLAVFLLGWFRGRPDLRARTAMSLTLAAALSTILVGIATGGDSVRRYNYPALLPGMLLLFPVLCRPRSQWRPEHPLDLPPDPPRRPAPRGRLLAASLACAIALYVGFNSFTWEYPWALRCLRTSLTDYRILPYKVQDPAEGDRIRRRYQALEAAIPATGAATLETLTDSYLLDFRQRPIFLADVPGAASPPSGWPARRSGDALARYLLARNVRYLAYSYADGASETDAAAAGQAANPQASQWIRSEAEIVLSAHRQYEELGRSRRHLYDDGNSFLLDLADPVPATPQTTALLLDPRLPLR